MMDTPLFVFVLNSDNGVGGKLVLRIRNHVCGRVYVRLCERYARCWYAKRPLRSPLRCENIPRELSVSRCKQPPCLLAQTGFRNYGVRLVPESSGLLRILAHPNDEVS